MSIASEITRLQNAKADIKTSIEAKGVTVPASAKIDTYDTYIDSISGGGGDDFGQLCLNIGTYSTSNLNLTGVTEIPSYAFAGKKVLTGALTFPSNIESISNNAFDSCSNITSLTIPSTLTYIGASAFSNCTGLIGTLTIPNTVTTIAQNSFYGCSGLTGLVVNAPVNYILNSVFQRCTSLTSVRLGSTIRAIANNSFASCTALSNLYLEYNGVVSLDYNTSIPMTNNITIHIPTGLTASYQSANRWSTMYNNGYLTILEDL